MLRKPRVALAQGSPREGQLLSAPRSVFLGWGAERKTRKKRGAFKDQLHSFEVAVITALVMETR